ncbi:MAG: amidinotransferase [Flavobacteriales bacterium]|mgnify:CR=1 FL=1|nr:amidinotransferase [Flavobacteriales bacterium]|tara:strand:+ start:112 stop:1050 length:939 start_codon:yes stop_codon:yes gene_type:complete
MNNQVTDTILMIKPCNFGYNPLTAKDNAYQNIYKDGLSKDDIAQKAIFEFENFVKVLKKAGIKVVEFPDSSLPYTPDSIFPNNWISTHSNGVVYLYPMLSINRRLERNPDIINYLNNKFSINMIVSDLLSFEDKNHFLEGTGSMVLDRVNRIAYACISKRTNKNLFIKWCDMANFQPISFLACDLHTPIYHTNVMMSICSEMVFICLESIVNKEEKEELLSLFHKTNKEIIDITLNQMNCFLGNVIELQNNLNESYLVMSSSAFKTLTDSQFSIINKKSKILHSPLDTIEYFGGGSARCMIAELFLNPNFDS